MKRILIVSLFVVFCFTPLTTLAEHTSVDAGSVELGVGNIAQYSFYFSGNNDDPRIFGFGLTPNLTIGYFLVNRLMFGVSFGLYNYKDDSMSESYTEFYIMPLVKYYFPLSDRFLLNLKVFFGYYRETDVGTDNFWMQFRVGGGLAVTYLIIPQLGINLGGDFANLSHWRYGGTEQEGTSDWGPQFYLGLNVYL